MCNVQMTKTKIKVNTDEWYGYSLEPEDELECKLTLRPYEDKWVFCLIYGGKHFWRFRKEFNSYETGLTFYNMWKTLYLKIPENVSPKWFEEAKFEWM